MTNLSDGKETQQQVRRTSGRRRDANEHASPGNLSSPALFLSFFFLLEASPAPVRHPPSATKATCVLRVHACSPALCPKASACTRERCLSPLARWRRLGAIEPNEQRCCASPLPHLIGAPCIEEGGQRSGETTLAHAHTLPICPPASLLLPPLLLAAHFGIFPFSLCTSLHSPRSLALSLSCFLALTSPHGFVRLSSLAPTSSKRITTFHLPLLTRRLPRR